MSLFLLIFTASFTLSQYNLQKLIDESKDGETLLLEPGIYEAEPVNYTDSLCGNCPEHKTIVPASRGFIIKNKSLHIKGTDKNKVILKTNAGYGVLFENSIHSSISSVTISGGVRDTSGNATNGGIVLKYSKVRIYDCIISNDTVRLNKMPVVGICGIVIREGSESIIRNNLISYNTWDGIALYRGATAYIMDNIIKYGRGAGIGITWDASAIVLRNSISGYWKGIGTFGTSNAVVKNNIIFDNLGWGIVISGNSYMLVENNVITRNGNCGIAPWCDSAEYGAGTITNNIITGNGWKNQWVCPGVGLWMNAPGERFRFEFNDVWNNLEGEYKDIGNQTGINGNVSVDPKFRGILDFRLEEDSPLIKTGNPQITNLDGSRSTMGIEGGQSVK